MIMFDCSKNCRHCRRLDRIETTLHRMERLMSEETEAISGLTSEFSGLADQFSKLVDDVRAWHNNAAGELSAEGKAELQKADDALTNFQTSVQNFQTEIGDADGSDTPVTQPTDPTLPTGPVTDTPPL